MEISSIERAFQIVGSQTALARLLGISDQAISKWKAGRVPAERVLDIEKATGGKVTRYELRPDIYPPELHRRGMDRTPA